MLSGCQHQFAWPRRAENGDYYQLCVTCGSKYGYDWKKMRRTARVSNDDAIKDDVATAHRSERKIAWSPRERRLRYHVLIEIKICGGEQWQQGISENISRSGLLFNCVTPLKINQAVELKLEMPRELTGEIPSQVLCLGLVARVTEVPAAAKDQKTYRVACSIVDYEFASKPPVRAAVQPIKIVATKERQKLG